MTRKPQGVIGSERTTPIFRLTVDQPPAEMPPILTLARPEPQTAQEPPTKFKLPEELVGTISPVPLRIGLSPKPEVTRKRSVSLEGKEGSRVDSTKYRGNGHWQFDVPMGGPEFNGFIYVIRDVVNEKLYLGRKQYRGLGKENKGQESNWRWYISSSKDLSLRVKAHGKDKFEFVCIEQYKTKGALGYAESWSLFHVEASFRQDKWYNLLINKVCWAVKEPISEKHKERLKMMMKAAGAL